MTDKSKATLYAEWIGQGEATRLQAAHHFGVHKSTAIYNLERACELGLIDKYWSWTDDEQRGWIYFAPTERQLLPFETTVYDEPGFEDYHPDAVMAAFADNLTPRL